MRILEDYVDLEAILELKPRDTGRFCDTALDAASLVEELEEWGPFAPLRKSFCEFLGIGESTLTGWIKENRVPRAAKVAYVLLVAIGVVQDEIRRLRQVARDFHILEDGDRFHLVLFKPDDTGARIGTVIARDLPDARTARILAASLDAFRMLQDSKAVIDDMLERTENPQYADHLGELRSRITRTTLAAFNPDKWREVFNTPLDPAKLFDGEQPTEQDIDDVINLAVETPSAVQDNADADNSGDRSRM